jgi:uncharacterized integral membrane protein
MMARLLGLLLLLPLLLVLVLFGLSNRQEVGLELWPFDLAWMVPLSTAMLVLAALAFLFGAIVGSAGTFAWRRRAKRLQEAARVLEAELAEHRAKAAKDVGPVPPVRNLPRLPRLQRPAA